MNKLLIGAIVAAAVVGAGAAVAQSATVAPQANAMHRSHMAEPMTRATVQSHVQQMFAHLDANRDGFIAKAEADAMKQQMHARMSGHMKSGDQSARTHRFEQIDSNRDGMISREEFAAAPRGKGMKMRRGGMHAGMGGKMFERADADKDGRVSLAEAQAAALAHFDRADLNRDGTITREERRQARQQMRAMRKAG